MDHKCFHTMISEWGVTPLDLHYEERGRSHAPRSEITITIHNLLLLTLQCQALKS